MAEGKVVVLLDDVRTMLLAQEALQAGADALCVDKPADAADRNEVRIEIEAALDRIVPALQAEQEESREYRSVAMLPSGTLYEGLPHDSLWAARLAANRCQARGCKNVHIQNRTTTKQGGWTVMSPWVDLDEAGEGR